jgi:hypothetical protein
LDKNLKVFCLIFFLGGLGDLITTIICLNSGFRELNFYVPFLASFILMIILKINFILLTDNRIKNILGISLSILSFICMINNIIQLIIW